MIAVVALLVVTAGFVTFCGVLSRQARAQSRERQAWALERHGLLDRLMHATDKTWTLPPRPEPDTEPERDPDAELLIPV